VPPEKLHWKQLKAEVIDTGLCTGCAGCVVACPYDDVLGYDHHWKPYQLPHQPDPNNCVHGQKGCTMCTRACPRFRAWEIEIDTEMFGRPREVDEVSGFYKDIVLARATDAEYLEKGQDGGLCSAMLIWCLRNGEVDGVLTSHLTGDGSSWIPIPTVATTEEGVLKGAGSRYTYSPNTLAYFDGIQQGLSKMALVGMGCQSSAIPMMRVRGARKPANKIALNIGLLCSKSFDDEIFDGLLKARYGIDRDEILKMNIKGKLQLWLTGDRFVEVPLKECHEFTREGCTFCPDFTAEHADISMGGLGQTGGWTLTLIRTDRGRDIFDRMVKDGWVEFKPAADEDPKAVELMHKLAAKSRERWPTPVEIEAGRPGLLPPKPAKAPKAPAAAG
jgi:coenzyme F420 hydrogenase subunit beta